MKQWYLYKCEVCGTASFTDSDHGSAWYASCGSCKVWVYHDQIVLGIEVVYPLNRIVFMDTKKERTDGESNKEESVE